MGFPPAGKAPAKPATPPAAAKPEPPKGKTIADSIKVKDAGSKDAPGVEKNVNLY